MGVANGLNTFVNVNENWYYILHYVGTEEGVF